MGPTTDIVEIAQNLPYGTHILKHDANDSDSNTMDFTLDGVTLETNSTTDRYFIHGRNNILPTQNAHQFLKMLVS